MKTSYITFHRNFTAASAVFFLIMLLVVPTAEAVGSNQAPVQRNQSQNQITLQKQQQLQVVATGYTAGIESTGKKPGHPQYGITRSGVRVRRGFVSTIAADPNVFPIGTVLYVPGYGYGIVADTGSAIVGHKIDLYFETKRQVFKQWGKRKVTVRVLRRGNGKLTESRLNALNQAVTVEKTIPRQLLES